MTLQEKLIVSAYTGVLLCDYPAFHGYASRILNKDVSTADFNDPHIWDELKLKVSADFMALSNSVNDEVKVRSMNLYDHEETFEDCTVQILTNTKTGECSIGWWLNESPPLGT